VTSRCPACGGVENGPVVRIARDYVTGERFEVQQCRRCGLGLTFPRPADLGRYYPTTYRQYGRATWTAIRLLYWARVRSWTRAARIRGVALEIGCGDGSMLRMLRDRGWRVVGVERQAAALDVARRAGMPVFVGDLRAVRPGALDLVVLFQTLEHLADPAGVVRGCAEILRPAGRIVVAVPNFESWQSRVLRCAWFHLDPPRHLTHFSERSLRRLLEATGFRVERVRYTSWEHDPYGWVQSTLNAVGFPVNLLTRWLMGQDRRRLGVIPSLTMLVLAIALIAPAVLLAVVSWVARAGAIVEVQATRT
jgi:SAM-dependent methyltransferase